MVRLCFQNETSPVINCPLPAMQCSQKQSRVFALVSTEPESLSETVKHSSSLKGNWRDTPCIPATIGSLPHSCSKYIYGLEWETQTQRLTFTAGVSARKGLRQTHTAVREQEVDFPCILSQSRVHHALSFHNKYIFKKLATRNPTANSTIHS